MPKGIHDHPDSGPEKRDAAGGQAFCLAEPGRQYLIYLISPGGLDVKLEGGPYQIEWIDPRDTAVRHRAGSTPDGQGLQTPKEGEDWLLFLTPSP